MIKTNIQLLNEISAKVGGKSDASVLVEALNNIANALGDTKADEMVTVPQALQTVLEYIDGGGGGFETVKVTVVNNDDSGKSLYFYGYDYLDSLPNVPILAYQDVDGQYYAGAYYEIGSGETAEYEFSKMGELFYITPNQNAEVTGDAEISWDDVIETYIVTVTGNCTITYFSFHII